MVFRGVPSQACQLCRLRKIKCDETRPSCYACIKSRKQCPGYKKDSGCISRDGRLQSVDRRAVLAIADGARLLSASQQIIKPALSQQLDYQAECHFVTNFILLPKKGASRGSMDYLLPILKHEDSNDHFRHAFRACALALFGNRLRTNRQCSRMALFECTQALQKVNRALRDPEAQREDKTLAAVLLLSLFETITKTNMSAWGSHIEGAIQLVKLRGNQQLETETEVLLFIAVRTQMIIYTLTCAKPPVLGVDWWADNAVTDPCAARCQRIMVNTTKLRATMTHLIELSSRTPEHHNAMVKMIRSCQTLDQEALRWMRDVPTSWRYRTVAWEDHMPENISTAAIYPGRIDVYEDFYIASIWNMARTARLILASLMVRSAAWLCAPLDVRTTPAYATASRNCTETVSAILASVPFHLGWDTESSQGRGQEAYTDTSRLKCLAGYFLIWPLSYAQSQDYTTDSQRSWVKGRLRFIGDNLGVKHAHTLAKLNVRIPSMLIQSDSLRRPPYSNTVGGELVESSRTTPACPGWEEHPRKQRDDAVQELIEIHRTELLSRATGFADEQTRWIAAKWLCF